MVFLSWYFACRTVGTENTKSSSSKVSALVSGSINRTAVHPTVETDVTFEDNREGHGGYTYSCTKQHTNQRLLGV